MQVRLTTAVVLMFAASGLLFVNLMPTKGGRFYEDGSSSAVDSNASEPPPARISNDLTRDEGQPGEEN